MRIALIACSLCLTAFVASCATPPSADPSRVELACAMQCSDNLTSCSSGFKLFPIVAQKQCNDVYDVCIKSCPSRAAESSELKPAAPPAASDRLKRLEDLYKAGTISKDEYDSKRKEILNSL